MTFKWDNWGLPYIEENDRSETMKLLAIYFANVMCYKKQFDLDFRRLYPTRERASEESIEEYDGYLTSHLFAYRGLLESKNIEYIQDADLFFSDKLLGSMYNNTAQIHPLSHPLEMDKNNLIALAAVMYIYNFTTILLNQPTLGSIFVYGLQRHRKFSWITDFLLLLKVKFGDVENMGLLLLTTKTNPTLFSKLAIKVYLTRKSFGRLWNEVIKTLEG